MLNKVNSSAACCLKIYQRLEGIVEGSLTSSMFLSHAKGSGKALLSFDLSLSLSLSPCRKVEKRGERESFVARSLAVDN